MKKHLFVILYLLTTFLFFSENIVVNAMPYYDLSPKKMAVRSSFTTYFENSSTERKNNIKLACDKINKTFLDINEEFSFNKIVGERNEKNGFQNAKIIKNGEFIDGVGGGVCQVSTTLYNAILLADLKIKEYHHHSLPVSYIEPSFDAMVNSNCADLRFINNTKNPIIIYSKYNDKSITFSIYGEEINYKIKREYKIIEKLPIETEYKIDDDNNFNLRENEEFIYSYGKEGFISVGYIIKEEKNKKETKKLIRKDRYNQMNKIIIKAKEIKENEHKIEKKQ